MAQLPFEIVKLIFSELDEEEILQCLLVNKLWNKIAIELVYTSVYLEGDRKISLYIRTITNSSHLCRYLKELWIDDYWTTIDINDVVWDKYGLLDLVIKQSPDIRIIDACNPNPAFWLKISHAATQGQLSRLQQLATCNTNTLEPYIFTALRFKNTLTQLSVSDEKSYYGPDLYRSDAYQILCDQIDQFINLECINLDYVSCKMIGDFDAMIDKFPKSVQYIFFHLCYDDRPQNKREPITLVSPRFGVKWLTINWDTINNDDQLRYIVQKFPNLLYLRIIYPRFGNARQIMPRCSYDAIMEFLLYSTTLSMRDIKLDVKLGDLKNIWTGVIKEKKSLKKLTIGYAPQNGHVYNNPVLKLKSRRSTIYFPYFSNNSEPHHIKFLSEVGNILRSLKIKNTRPYGGLMTLEGMIECLQQCPLLQELTFHSLKLKPLFNPTEIKHTELKWLSIIRHDCTEQLDYLEHMSNYFPNLEKVDLHCNAIIDTKVLSRIYVPTINLGILACAYEIPYRGKEKHLPRLIKLDVNGQFHYLKYIKHALQDISPEAYNDDSFECYRIFITCKSIKKLRMQTFSADHKYYNDTYNMSL